MKQATTRRRLTLTASVAAALALVACGDRTDRTTVEQPTTTAPTASVPSNTAAPSPSAVTAPSAGAPAAPSDAPGVSSVPGSTVATSDREFVSLAASSDQLEVESGRLALEKSKNSNVRSFAQHMVDDHTKTSTNLKQIATAVGATPPESMAPPHQAHLEKLRALDGAEFDREYAAQIGVAAHQEAVALFERASREAANADIRAFAEKTLPDLRDHLQQGQTLAKNLGVSADRLRNANAPPDLSSLSAMVSGSGTQGGAAK